MTDGALQKAVLAADEADMVALDALRQAMAPGRRLIWAHGDQWRAGYVVEVLGFRLSHARVRVKGAKSGKVFDVDARAILQQL